MVCVTRIWLTNAFKLFYEGLSGELTNLYRLKKKKTQTQNGAVNSKWPSESMCIIFQIDWLESISLVMWLHCDLLPDALKYWWMYTIEIASQVYLTSICILIIVFVVVVVVFFFGYDHVNIYQVLPSRLCRSNNAIFFSSLLILFMFHVVN